jgi:hypothetical protein
VFNAQRALAASVVPQRPNVGQVSRDIQEDERPISEQFRIVALQFSDADAAANLMEELKTVNLEKFKTDLMAEQGQMPDNRAERIVKASPAWEQYIKDMCAHRAKATKLKLQIKYLEMKFQEWQSREANARVERRL